MSTDDERFAGVPRQSPRPPSATPGMAHHEPTAKPDLPASDARDSEERKAGVPIQRPKSFVEPVASEMHSADVFREVEQKISGENAGGPSNSWRLLRSPVLISILILLASAFLIIVLSEVFQFAQAIQSAPLPLQVGAYFIVGALAVAFCWSLIRLFLVYWRLTTSPQVRLDNIRDARLRAVTRDQIARQLDAGYDSLRTIVEKYPIDDQEQLALLKRGGFTDDDVATLRSNIQFLMRPEGAGKAKWLEDCERLFVGTIDRCAKNRVARYAKRVAVKTAISPTGLLDSLIFAVNAVFLVEELCKLYYVRTSLGNSVLVAARLVFSTFVSARLEDQIDEVTDSLFDGVLSSIPEISKEIFAKFTLGVLKRTAEGAVNLALFYRLGGAAILYLRPIRLK